MNHADDEQPSAGDARPFLPTEIEHPYPTNEHARRYLPMGHARPSLPTEIEPPSPPAHARPGINENFMAIPRDVDGYKRRLRRRTLLSGH